MERGLNELKDRLGWKEYDRAILKWRYDRSKSTPRFIRGTIESYVYALAGGDFTKMEAVKKMKISEAEKLKVLKDLEGFLIWYDINKDKIHEPFKKGSPSPSSPRRREAI